MGLSTLVLLGLNGHLVDLVQTGMQVPDMEQFERDLVGPHILRKGDLVRLVQAGISLVWKGWKHC